MAEADRLAPPGVLITHSYSGVSRYLCGSGQGCLCAESERSVLHLNVHSCGQAEDEVQKVFHIHSVASMNATLHEQHVSLAVLS